MSLWMATVCTPIFLAVRMILQAIYPLLATSILLTRLIVIKGLINEKQKINSELNKI